MLESEQVGAKSEQRLLKSEQKVNRLLLLGIFCSLLGCFWG